MNTGDRPGTVRSLRLSDGRRLAYREYGAPQGHPVLAFHGTPGSGIMFAIAANAAVQLGLRLIAVDRWGYGQTDLHPRPALAAWPADVAQLVGHLGLSRFAVLGISGGGPYAVAMAGLLPDHVERTALAVPVGLIGQPGMDAHLNVIHKLLFRRLPRHPRLMRTLLELYRKLVMRDPARAIRISSVGQAPSDRRILKMPAIQNYLGEMFRDGLAPGVAGVTTDLELFSKPWGLPLRDIKAATRIWIGLEDRLVPLPASSALASSIPGAAKTELAGQGHFWITTDYKQVLKWLATPSEDDQVRR